MMRFELQARLTLSSDISGLSSEFERFIAEANQSILRKGAEKLAVIERFTIENETLCLWITSEGTLRPHNTLLQIKNALSKELGKSHHIGVRDITITTYTISFDLPRPPRKKVSIPFADVTICLLYTSPSPRDRTRSRMPSSA